MKHQLLKLNILVALGVSAILGSMVTFLDWRLNPGGVFRSTDATNWIAVFETWLSWFGPSFVLILAVCLVLSFVFDQQQ